MGPKDILVVKSDDEDMIRTMQTQLTTVLGFKPQMIGLKQNESMQVLKVDTGDVSDVGVEVAAVTLTSTSPEAVEAEIAKLPAKYQSEARSAINAALAKL
jgi:hypothetical protein